jgi:hypothetical protein
MTGYLCRKSLGDCNCILCRMDRIENTVSDIHLTMEELKTEARGSTRKESRKPGCSGR